MKKIHRIFLVVLLIVFAGYRLTVIEQRKMIMTISGETQTFADLLAANRIPVKIVSQSQFEKIIYSSKIRGVEEISDVSKMQEYECLYEYNLSGGLYWVQKVASPVNPVLFYYRLYERDEKLFILVTYSTQSEKGKQTQDYNALYEYLEITPNEILNILPR